MTTSHSYICGTSLGNLLHIISKGKLLPYPEEINPSLHAGYIAEDALEPSDFSRSKSQTPSSSPILVDWHGPDDPENPQNWSSTKKLFVTAQLCFLNFAVYIGSSIYTSGIAGVMEQFDVSETVATLGLTLFVLGYGLGPMLWSPMSDIPQIGRNPTYIWTLAVFVLVQIPVALAPNIGVLLFFRVVSGFFGSPALATAGASIGDMYAPSKLTYGITIYGSIGVCGPVMGPLIGGFVAEALGWKWTIWTLMLITGSCFSLLFVFLPETSAHTILYHRALRLRTLTGKPAIKAHIEMSGPSTSLLHTIFHTVTEAFSLAFTEPIVLFINLYSALVYGLLYMWFEFFALAFTSIYDFPPAHEGLAFLGILTGTFVVVPLYLLYYRLKIEPRFRPKSNENGECEVKPETFIPPACIGAFSVPICLFWFGWTAREDIHWLVPIVGSAFYAVGVVLLFNPVFIYLGATYPRYTASVFGGNAFARAGFGGAFPLFSRAMYHRLGVGGASSLLGGLSILFIPIPLVLYFFGERIRKASKRATHSL